MGGFLEATNSLMRKYRLGVCVVAAGFPSLLAGAEGEELFTMNCAACHLLNEMVVGPSLVEMRQLYEGKPAEFVKWSMAPGKKRDGAIQMPSMVHVGEEGLLAIYEHVMKVSEGVTEKEKKGEKGDPFAASAIHLARPQIQRIFMPNAGPAAIAIALDEDVSLCWDAGECRLRYAWTGDFIDGYPYWKGNGMSLAKVLGEVRYTEEASPFQFDLPLNFKGYRVREGLPVLRYEAGEHLVTETYRSAEEDDGFTRTFTIEPPMKEELVLNFPSEEAVTFESDRGEWNGSQLKVKAEDTKEFTVTTIFR